MAGHALEEVEASLLVQDRVGRPETDTEHLSEHRSSSLDQKTVILSG